MSALLFHTPMYTNTSNTKPQGGCGTLEISTEGAVLLSMFILVISPGRGSHIGWPAATRANAASQQLHALQVSSALLVAVRV